MKQIELTKGLYTLVSDEDFGPLSQYEWTAGWAGTRYYAKRWDVLEQKNIYMHRQILGDPASMVDHANGHSLDNRRSNLRSCSHSTNAHNGKMRRGSSKYRGVTWDKKKAKWMARIRVNLKYHWLGYHENEDDAAAAYDKAAKCLVGEFADLNFPRELE